MSQCDLVNVTSLALSAQCYTVIGCAMSLCTNLPSSYATMSLLYKGGKEGKTYDELLFEFLDIDIQAFF